MKRAEEGTWTEVYHWFWGAAERWPEIFDEEKMRQLFIVAESRGKDESKIAVVGLLRAALLRQLYVATRGCMRCPLSSGRLHNTPVLDDGDYELDLFAETLGEAKVPIGPLHAQIMIVAEGPGEYEQRTGLPLVSFQSLHGSRCVRGCGDFERCFPVPSADDRSWEERKPGQACRPRSLKQVAEKAGKELVQIRTERADRRYYQLNTCGELVDRLLVMAPELSGWAWRNSWNARLRLMTSTQRGPQEATLYVTNSVKCRKTASGENAKPTKSEIDTCRRYLEAQLYIVQPKVIVALGKPAVYALSMQDPEKLKITDTEKVWGVLQPTPYGIPMIPAPHPSWALRSGDRVEDYRAKLTRNLALAKQVVDGEVPAPSFTPLLEVLAAGPGDPESQAPVDFALGVFAPGDFEGVDRGIYERTWRTLEAEKQAQEKQQAAQERAAAAQARAAKRAARTDPDREPEVAPETEALMDAPDDLELRGGPPQIRQSPRANLLPDLGELDDLPPPPPGPRSAAAPAPVLGDLDEDSAFGGIDLGEAPPPAAPARPPDRVVTPKPSVLGSNPFTAKADGVRPPVAPEGLDIPGRPSTAAGINPAQMTLIDTLPEEYSGPREIVLEGPLAAAS